jgi:hypothetical protein
VTAEAHARLDFAARTHLNGTHPISHFFERRRFDVIECQRDRAAVKFEHHVSEDFSAVPFGLQRRDALVGIAIDQRDDAIGDSCTRRQIDFQRHAAVCKRHARGLQILVETMRGRRRGQHNEQASCRRCAGAFHRLVILAA